MFVFKFGINMLPFVDDIKPRFWYLPTVPGMAEQVLVEITDAVGIGLVYLADAFRFDDFLESLAIHFGVKCQLDGVYDVFVELLQVYMRAIQFNRLFDMVEYRFIGNKS